MLIASIGQRVDPIAQLLNSKPFAVLKLIRYGKEGSDSLLEEIECIVPNTDVSIHELELPVMDGKDTGEGILRDLFRQLMEWTERSPDSYVCVTGGTPWLSHTLHHAATLANLPVIVGTHETIEGEEVIFEYPKPLETERMRTTLETKYSNRCPLLKQIEKTGRPTITELAKAIGVGEETVRFMLNGRERGLDGSADLVVSGLTGMKNPLIRLVGKRTSVKRGPKAWEYELTEDGRDVVALLS